MIRDLRSTYLEIPCDHGFPLHVLDLVEPPALCRPVEDLLLPVELRVECGVHLGQDEDLARGRELHVDNVHVVVVPDEVGVAVDGGMEAAKVTGDAGEEGFAGVEYLKKGEMRTQRVKQKTKFDSLPFRLQFFATLKNPPSRDGTKIAEIILVRSPNCNSLSIVRFSSVAL